jgi:hypothetical protein
MNMLIGWSQQVTTSVREFIERSFREIGIEIIMKAGTRMMGKISTIGNTVEGVVGQNANSKREI